MSTLLDLVAPVQDLPRNIVGAFGVSDSDFQKLDQDLTGNTTRMTSRQGNQLLATMEVYHQLHCLVR